MNRQMDWDAVASELRIRFPYDEKLLEVVRGLPGRRWHPAGKYWSVPSEHLSQVCQTLLPLGFAFSEELNRRLEVERVDGPVAGNEFESPLLDRDPARIRSSTYSVSELNDRVRSALRETFPQALWIQGEVLGYDRNAHKRHVYFQLAEKNEGEDRPRAVVTAVLFEGVRGQIEDKLRNATESLSLRDGVRLRIQGRIDLYPATGSYQVVVEDLDVEFTLGEIALRRERILAEIDRRDLRECNLSLPFPRPSLRIGLITSFESDAYNDFINELDRSRYCFQVAVFDCHVQGERVEHDVLAAIALLRDRAQDFDVVAIIRGGGARTDLMGFDSLPLALAVATLPLKVIVGIGHHRDRSVLDFIAHSEKTPTAVAKVLVERCGAEVHLLSGASERVVSYGRTILASERERLEHSARGIRRGVERRLERSVAELRLRTQGVYGGTRRRLERERLRIQHRWERIRGAVHHRADSAGDEIRRSRKRLAAAAGSSIDRVKERLEARRRHVRGLDPLCLLTRGFAWLRTATGRSIKRCRDTAPGQEIVARLADGELEARVERVQRWGRDDAAGARSVPPRT